MIRKKEIDALRGILILCVVLGHAGHGILHDFVFLFHMPLFIMLSGLLISKARIAEKGYFIKKSPAIDDSLFCLWNA